VDVSFVDGASRSPLASTEDKRSVVAGAGGIGPGAIVVRGTGAGVTSVGSRLADGVGAGFTFVGDTDAADAGSSGIVDCTGVVVCTAVVDGTGVVGGSGVVGGTGVVDGAAVVEDTSVVDGVINSSVGGTDAVDVDTTSAVGIGPAAIVVNGTGTGVTVVNGTDATGANGGNTNDSDKCTEVVGGTGVIPFGADLGAGVGCGVACTAHPSEEPVGMVDAASATSSTCFLVLRIASCSWALTTCPGVRAASASASASNLSTVDC